MRQVAAYNELIAPVLRAQREIRQARERQEKYLEYQIYLAWRHPPLTKLTYDIRIRLAPA